MRRTRGVAALACLAAGALVLPARAATPCPQPGWPTYGRSVARTFNVPDGCSPITTSSVRTLVPAWFFHAKDSITASPAVVDGVLYVGSWNGEFYALDATTGAVKWTYLIDDTHGVAFGRIVSSAAVIDLPGPSGAMTRVVVFGGGATVYVLDAKTGTPLAKRDLDPRAPAARKDNGDQIEIESSPAVVTMPGTPARERRIFVGMDVHNDRDVGRTGIVSLRLTSAGGWRLDPVWKFDPETSRVYPGAAGLTTGSGKGFGCGGVWSSPAVSTTANVVVFGTASCSHDEDARAARENWAESMYGIRADTGALLWHYRPADDIADIESRNADPELDDDFGASPALFRLKNGRAVAGEGRKSAGYYVRDERSGKPVSFAQAGMAGHAQDGFAIGGFLGTPAVQLDAAGRAMRVVGGTAIPFMQPNEISADNIDRTTWAVRALDPQTGAIEWSYRLAGPTYAATSVVNGVAFVAATTMSSVLAIDTQTGLLLWQGIVPGPPSSTAVVAGDSVYVGTGTRETDAEFKAFGSQLQDVLGTLGPHPLSPASGVMAYRLAG